MGHTDFIFFEGMWHRDTMNEVKTNLYKNEDF